MKVKTEIDIKAPIGKVHETFADIGNLAERVPGITKVEILSETSSGEGVRWRETRTIFGKEATEEMEMTSQDIPNSYVVEAESHGNHYTTTLSFKENEDVTNVQVVFEGKPMSIGAKLMTPLGLVFKGATKKILLSDMQAIKSFLETEDTQP